MTRFLRITGVAVVALLAFLLIAGVLLQLVFGSSLKALVVKTINDNLDAPLIIHGDVEFSVFRSFPFMSVDFNGVELKEGIKGSDKPLLTAERVSMQFNVMSVLRGNNTIRRIRISNGRLSTAIDQHGNGNYFVFKKSEGNEGADVKLDEILLSNVSVLHNDIYNRQSYSLGIEKAKASGNFSASHFKSDVVADVLIHDANVQGTRFLPEKTATLDLAIDIDMDNNVYTFERCALKVSEASFEMKGSVAETNKGYELDLNLNGNDVGLEELGSLLPAEYVRPIQSLETRGGLTCVGSVKGLISKKSNPAVEFRFGVKDGTIKDKESGETLNDVNVNAVYTNGATRTWNGSKLVVSNATLKFDDQPFQCSFELTRFDRPMLNLSVNGLVDLAAIKPFLGLSDDAELNGEMQVINFEYKGVAQALGSKQTAATQSEGMLVFRNVNYSDDGLSVSSFNGTVVSNGNSLRIQKANGLVGETDLAVSGEIQNMIPALLVGFEKTPMQFNLSVHADRFNTADFLVENTAGTDTTANKPSDNWFNSMTGRIVCSVMEFRHEKFTARNVETSLLANNGVLRFNGLRFDALQGSTRADGTLDLRRDNLQVLETTFACSNINVTRLFREFDDFSQTEFTGDNINGTLNTNCYLKAIWRNGAFQPNDLVAVADVTVDKGELNDFKPMHALSKFAKVEELDNIRFSRLSNQIEIRGGVIRIPATVIRSSVMTVEIAGTHTLENFIDYRLKLNLSEIIGRKFKKTSSFDPEATESGVDGTFNLYVLMKGPAGNPVITYDKRSVKHSVQENLAHEKKDLKDVLKREFTRQEQKKQTVKEWQEPEEYELIDFDASADEQNR